MLSWDGIGDVSSVKEQDFGVSQTSGGLEDYWMRWVWKQKKKMLTGVLMREKARFWPTATRKKSGGEF